jgi:hypothetical protein
MEWLMFLALVVVVVVVVLVLVLVTEAGVENVQCSVAFVRGP